MTFFIPITTDGAWLAGWTAQYLHLLEEMLADQSDRRAEVLARAAEVELWNGYQTGRLSVASAAAWMLASRYVGELFRLDEEPRVIRHLVITAAQALEQTGLAESRGERTANPIEATIFATLNPQSIPALRRIVDHSYTSWRELRRSLIEDTPTTDIWLGRLRDILPSLAMYQLLPTHELVKRDGMAGGIVRENEYIPDHDREPRPFYLRLFSDAERAAHDADQKMIDETWANVRAAIDAHMAFGDAPFERYGSEIDALCRAGEYLQARQRIALLQQTRLSIPSWVAERFLDRVQAAKKAVKPAT